MAAPFPAKIDALTGLRFFAALAIVLHHLSGVMFVKPGAFGTLALAQGVSFFFVLSGFVLQHAYREKVQALGWARFFGLRFARLWPVHVAVIAIIAMLGAEIRWGDLIPQLLLVQAWRGELGDVYAISGPAWSISVELFFYAVFPFLCGPAAKRPLLLIAAVAGFTAIYLAVLTLAHDSGANVNAFARVNPLARVMEFVLGVTAYEFARRWRTPKGTIAELAVLALAWIAFVKISNYTAIHHHTPFEDWFRLAGSAPIFALAIVVLARQRGLISQALSWRPLVYLGDVSFALYLVHHPIIVYFEHHPLAGVPELVQIVLFAGGLLAISAALYQFVERPTMAQARRLLMPRRPGIRIPPAPVAAEADGLVRIRAEHTPPDAR